MFALLMLGHHDRIAAFDLQVYGKSIRNDSRHTVRRQPHQQTSNGIRRSLDFENFNIHVAPTSSKISLPTMVRLYPPTAKPLHMHANLPLRFGREYDSDDDRLPKSSPNLPQRFGRSWEVIRMCAECPDVEESSLPTLPQRFGRSSLSWSLFRTLASDWPLNTDWYR
ncbi:pro-FMRFamide-related neuropeptide VF [Myripristis murdjan]|uniref:pro-FMRFamide-related neuropeptide VF n=1 Tax=Myripristis murdjan TaxID=586833 RepID=UPI00117645EE|nr:pro-FMRFamide-related neuropeptide VF [Myripristis murdjan]